MASAGGHWAKSNFPGHVGQRVFVPKVQYTTIGEANQSAYIQGEYVVVASAPKRGAEPSTFWMYSYNPKLEDGLGVIITNFKRSGEAMAAMEALNATGAKNAGGQKFMSLYNLAISFKGQGIKPGPKLKEPLAKSQETTLFGV